MPMPNARVLRFCADVDQQSLGSLRIRAVIELDQPDGAYELRVRLILRDSLGAVLWNQVHDIDGLKCSAGIASFDECVPVRRSALRFVRVQFEVEEVFPSQPAARHGLIRMNAWPAVPSTVRVAFDADEGVWMLVRVCKSKAVADALVREASRDPAVPSHHMRLGVAADDEDALLTVVVDVEGLYQQLLLGIDDHGPVVAAVSHVLCVPEGVARQMIGRLHGPAPAGYEKRSLEMEHWA